MTSENWTPGTWLLLSVGGNTLQQAARRSISLYEQIMQIYPCKDKQLICRFWISTMTYSEISVTSQKFVANAWTSDDEPKRNPNNKHPPPWAFDKQPSKMMQSHHSRATNGLQNPRSSSWSSSAPAARAACSAWGASGRVGAVQHFAVAVVGDQQECTCKIALFLTTKIPLPPKSTAGRAGLAQFRRKNSPTVQVDTAHTVVSRTVCGLGQNVAVKVFCARSCA